MLNQVAVKDFSSVFETVFSDPFQFKKIVQFNEQHLENDFSSINHENMLCTKFKIRSKQMEFQSKIKYQAILIKNRIYILSEQDKLLENPLFVLNIEFSNLIVNYTEDDSTNEEVLHSFTLKRGISLILFEPCKVKDTQQQQIDSIIIKWAKALSYFTVSEDILSRYEIIRQIGQGANATVYKVVSRQDKKKKFAMKIINKKHFDKKPFRTQQLASEIRINRELSQTPGVIKLFEVSETKANIYMLLDLVEGGTLKDLVQGPLWSFKEKNIKIISRQLIEILTNIHEKEVLHRDIKPENILINNLGKSQYKIFFADFGLSSFLSDTTQLKIRCGTPSYAAPETIMGKEQTPKIDIFSVGSVIYYLFTGENLIKGQNSNQILNLTLKSNFKQIIGQICCSYQARDFLNSLICRDPANRFDINQALNHEWIKSSNLRSICRNRSASPTPSHKINNVQSNQYNILLNNQNNNKIIEKSLLKSTNQLPNDKDKKITQKTVIKNQIKLEYNKTITNMISENIESFSKFEQQQDQLRNLYQSNQQLEESSKNVQQINSTDQSIKYDSYCFENNQRIKQNMLKKSKNKEIKKSQFLKAQIIQIDAEYDLDHTVPDEDVLGCAKNLSFVFNYKDELNGIKYQQNNLVKMTQLNYPKQYRVFLDK
eukprot:403360791